MKNFIVRRGIIYDIADYSCDCGICDPEFSEYCKNNIIVEKKGGLKIGDGICGVCGGRPIVRSSKKVNLLDFISPIDKSITEDSDRVVIDDSVWELGEHKGYDDCENCDLEELCDSSDSLVFPCEFFDYRKKPEINVVFKKKN